MATSASKPSYGISELAKEFSITTRSIRFYEEKGLISPARKGSSRIYSAGDRVKLKLILRGKRLGLTLAESQDIIDMYDPRHGNVDQLHKLIDKIRYKRAALEQQRLDIDSMLSDLRDSEEKCLQALNEQSGRSSVQN